MKHERRYSWRIKSFLLVPNSLIEVLPRQGLSICQMTVFIKLDYFSLTDFSWSNSYLHHVTLKDCILLLSSSADFLRRDLGEFQKETDNLTETEQSKTRIQKWINSFRFLVPSTEKFTYHFPSVIGSRLNCSTFNWNGDSSSSEFLVSQHLRRS